LSTKRDFSQSVGHLGEDSLRVLVSSHLDKDTREMLGYGDDAIAIEIGDGKILVAHTNVLVGSTDILPGMTPSSIGRKAVVMNVSDIAAKGAKPLTLLFSLGIPKDYLISHLEEIASGMNAAARENGTYITGGDIGESNNLILAGTALGMARKGELMARSGAKVGDLLASTGPFGLTSLGFKILLENLEAPSDIEKKALEAVYKPKARLKEALALAEIKAVTASIDSSDGLAKSLHWLSRMSGIGFELTNILLSPEVTRFAQLHKLDPNRLALYEGGEEYELIVCIKPEKWNDAVEAVKRVGGVLYEIGRVTESRKIVLRTRDGRQEEIEDLGWEHFRQWKAE